MACFLYPHCLLTTLQNTGLKFASSALFSLPWAHGLVCLAQEQDIAHRPLQFSCTKTEHPVSGSWVCSPGSWWSGLTFFREDQQPKWGSSLDPPLLQRVCLPQCCPWALLVALEVRSGWIHVYGLSAGKSHTELEGEHILGIGCLILWKWS